MHQRIPGSRLASHLSPCTSSTTCSPRPPATSRSSPTPRGTCSPAWARSCRIACAARARPAQPGARPRGRLRPPRAARFPGRLEAELRRERRCRGPSSPARSRHRSATRSGAGWRAHTGRVRLALRARDGTTLEAAARRARRPRRGRRARAHPMGPGDRGERGMSHRPRHPRRRRRAARADRHQAPARDLGLGRARGHGDVGQGGARLPLGRPLRRALPRRGHARDRGHGARRACCGASPTRRPSSSSPAIRTRRSRRSRSRRWTSWSSR